MRWRWIGRRLPPFMRGRTRARLRFQRQRAPSMGWGSTAWVRTSAAFALRQHRLHAGEREAVLGPEREHDGVVVGRRLQLEVERDAEPLAQRQPERAVDAATEGRVDDQLRALAVVEAALDDDALAGRQVAQRGQAGGAVGDDLLGHLGRHPGSLGHEPARPVAVSGAQQRLERGPQIAHGLGELGGAGRRLAEPEGDGRRQVPGVVDPDRADLDLGHPPRVRARGGRCRRPSPRPRSPRAPSRPSRRRGRARRGSHRSRGWRRRRSARPAARPGGRAADR